jgi:aspartate beta-hydroxylase
MDKLQQRRRRRYLDTKITITITMRKASSNSWTVLIWASSFFVNKIDVAYPFMPNFRQQRSQKANDIVTPKTKIRIQLFASSSQQGTTTEQQYEKKKLTDRQLQFWEDVDNGLDEIADFYSRRGMSIDRVRQFAETARGERPPPTGYMPGHEPSEEHIEGLTARPFWDTASNPSLFPWAAELERNAGIIQEEFSEKLRRDGEVFAADSAWQNQVMGAGWSAIRLQRLGVWNVENCQEFKQTYELLRSLNCPFAVRGVCFARQLPQSGVQPHSDGRNFILTSHLGLQVPKGCWIEVGGERREWEEGKLITLDTSFSHSTCNPTEESRNVLIIDFWHPELTEAERAALEFVYDLRNKFESGLVPFRKPRSATKKKNADVENGGGLLGSFWKSISGG